MTVSAETFEPTFEAVDDSIKMANYHLKDNGAYQDYTLDGEWYQKATDSIYAGSDLASPKYLTQPPVHYYHAQKQQQQHPVQYRSHRHQSLPQMSFHLQEHYRQQQQRRPLATIPPPNPVLPPAETMNKDFLKAYIPSPVLLGSGGFGFVKMAVRKLDSIEVAVKFILKEKVPSSAWAKDPVLGVVPTEVYILKNVSHPNVIKYVEYFEDNIYSYLVTELYGKSWDR
ncbi:UNVERIFIED_CONTAM: hypothetical protein HDU68_006403, partial [Siphonaria sp. JEL0065]